MSNNTIQIKRSSVAGRVPDANTLAVGEFAVNLADKVLYSKDGTGNVIVIASSNVDYLNNGSVNKFFSNTAVLANVKDYLTYGVTGYYVNGNGGANGQVLIANGDNTSTYRHQFFVGEIPPDFNHYGDIWYDTFFNRLFMWVNDGQAEYFYDFLPPNF
jgi:hypothetical protein